HQAERCRFARPMARRAVIEDDGRDVFGERHGILGVHRSFPGGERQTGGHTGRKETKGKTCHGKGLLKGNVYLLCSTTISTNRTVVRFPYNRYFANVHAG